MIEIGIMGAGSIAIKMANTVNEMKSANLYGVASRDIAKAQKFADTYYIEHAYGSYEEMVRDPAIDLVYVATPHSHHYHCAKMALNAGKHVLCEKAFTVNAEQAKALIQLAKDKKLLITEALWTRYMPSRKILNDVLVSGIIGDVVSLNVNLGYYLPDIERIHDPKLAGGALLDVGVYVINFARMVFGTDIVDVEATAIFENGVDITDNITFKYADNKMATLQCGVNGIYNRLGAIYGTKGLIEVQNINNPEAIRIYNDNYELIDTIGIPEQISGYEYEVEACVKAIKNGEIECSEMPHEETIAIMQIMDSIRKSWHYEIPLID